MHRRAALALLLLPGLMAAGPAGAVITTVSDTGLAYGITLRVGMASGVDTVAFAVSGNNAGLTPVPVTGAPAIDVSVTPVRPLSLAQGAPRPVTLRVDSTLGMPCASGGCSGTTIPFSKISWTATNNSAAGSGDIVTTGTFDGTSQQAITSPATGFDANATTCVLLPVLLCTSKSRNLTATRMTFTYANDTVYPAGVYKGTVRFTATME